MDIPSFLVDRLKAGRFTRVVAFGSSNTERRVPGMHWFDCFELACRHTFGPHTVCINSGKGGDTTFDLLARFQRDCLDYRPDLVFITVGGNDSNPSKNMTSAQYRENLVKIIREIQAIGSRTVVQTYYGCDLVNIDPRHANAFVDLMVIAREVAAETDSLLIDHLARWERLRQRAYGVYRGLMVDAMHVNEKGNQLMGFDIARTFSLNLPEHDHFREARTLQALLDELTAGANDLGAGKCV